MITTKIIVQPFNTEILVMKGITVEHCLKEYNKRFLPKCNGKNSIYKHDFGGVLIINKDNLLYWALILTDKQNVGSIVHECFHLIMRLAKSKGCVWSEDSDEFYAYSLTQLVNEVLTFYNNIK